MTIHGPKSHRVAAYVDGFNLYNGLHDARGRRALWLDLEKLLSSVVRPGQQLIEVHYFTAAVSGPSGVRQQTYLDALSEHGTRTKTYVGRFQRKTITCRTCSAAWTTAEEKETDVSLGVLMVEHAALDKYDTALLVSGDSDMCPAIRSVKRIAPAKRVVTVFPPRRSSIALRAEAHGSYQLGDRVPERHQLPALLTRVDGTMIQRPAYWK